MLDANAFSSLKTVLESFMIEPKIIEKNGTITVMIEKEDMHESVIKALKLVAKKKQMELH